ncbi:MAG TPA: hypothetical protein VMV49_09040 [Candidatus Deferrimicrobium sp.]|nr:hypothetical protein [Candidatus Deferrimicrobium sp.]
MITGIWVVHTDGKCLYYREYRDLNINEQLFSGFLVAILSFSKEISQRQLKSINLDDIILYYKYTDQKIIFVVAADSDDREDKIREKIDLIEEAFFREFGEIIPIWNNDITVFQKFDTELDKILNSKGLKLHKIDFNFINKGSFEKLIEKFTNLFVPKDKNELEKLDHTVGFLENITDKMNRFYPPNFLIDAPKKVRSALKRIISKNDEKKD